MCSSADREKTTALVLTMKHVVSRPQQQVTAAAGAPGTGRSKHSSNQQFDHDASGTHLAVGFLRLADSTDQLVGVRHVAQVQDALQVCALCAKVCQVDGLRSETENQTR